MGTTQNRPVPPPAPSPAVRVSAGTVEHPVFFTHLRLGWWRTVAVIVVLMAAFFALQFLPGAVAVGVLSATGAAHLAEDPARLVGHPVMILAANVSLGLMVPVTLLVVARIGGVPWRGVLAVGRRFSWRRLLTTAATAVPVFALGTGATALLIPDGYGPFALTGAAAAMLAVIVCTVPLAAAAEEVVFRGGIGPLIGSRVGTGRAAAAAGLVGSTAVFAAVHFSTDPWLVLYQLWIGVSAGLLAIITRGVEASIALHTAHNLVLFAASALFAGDGIVIDRSATGGDASMMVALALVPCHVAVLAIVSLRERRRRSR